jgi:hypothetical protein
VGEEEEELVVASCGKYKRTVFFIPACFVASEEKII